MLERLDRRLPDETDIWGTSKLVELLKQPMGSPIELTREEALQIIRLAAGRRPDLPSGADYIAKVDSFVTRHV